MPLRDGDGLSSDTLQMSTVSRMPLRDGDSLWNNTLLYANSADSADFNGTGSAGRQRHRQRQTSDSLTPTLRNWENTRSARV